MATFTHGSKAVLKINDGSSLRDVSTATGTASIDFGKDAPEVTAMTNTAKAYIPGLPDATLSADGSRDVTIEGYLYGAFTAAAAVAWEYYPEGTTTGLIKYSGNCIVTAFNPSSSVDDANKWSIELQTTGGVTRATI